MYVCNVSHVIYFYIDTCIFHECQLIVLILMICIYTLGCQNESSSVKFPLTFDGNFAEGEPFTVFLCQN